MDEQTVKEFAWKHGFDDAKMLGEYGEYKVFQPFFADKKTRTIGFPQYILQKNDELSLKIDLDFEVTDHFFPQN